MRVSLNSRNLVILFSKHNIYKDIFIRKFLLVYSLNIIFLVLKIEEYFESLGVSYLRYTLIISIWGNAFSIAL